MYVALKTKPLSKRSQNTLELEYVNRRPDFSIVYVLALIMQARKYSEVPLKWIHECLKYVYMGRAGKSVQI